MNRRVRRAINALTQLAPDINLTYKAERGLEKVTSAVRIKPPGYKAWDRKVINPGTGSEIPVRIFMPPKKKAESLLLFFHGGGWVLGNIESYSRFCVTLAEQTGWAVASVDYRLAPECPFPAGLEDCYTVARELYMGGFTGVPGERVVMAGDSAGGNLSAAVSLMARDRGEFLPEAQILIYPAAFNDYSDNSPFQSVKENGTGYLLTSKRITALVNMYMRDRNELDNPYFAPLLAKDFSGLPRTLIITAEFDPLRDEGEFLGRKLSESGNDVSVHRIPDALHGFMSLSPRFSSVKEGYKIINKFLEYPTKGQEQL